MNSLEVSDHGSSAAVSSFAKQQLPPLFDAHDIRDDVVRAHLSMNVMRTDAEARRCQRFADYGPLEDEKSRVRLLWKSRPRFVKPPEAAPEMSWRSTQTVW